MGLVAAVSKVLALVIAAAAALAAALIVLPSVSHKVALAAIVASERSALIAAAAVVALPLAFFGFTRGRRAPSTLAVLLAVAAVGMSLLPLLQARSLARTRGVSLDMRRYLQAKVDTEGPGTPDRTVIYASVGTDCRPSGGRAHRPMRAGWRSTSTCRGCGRRRRAGRCWWSTAGSGPPARRARRRSRAGGSPTAGTPCSTSSTGSRRSPTGRPRPAT